MRLLNKGFFALLAALGFFCSGCHAAGMHAFCYHGNSTPGYFAPSAPAEPYSYHTHSNSRHWWSPRSKKAHSDNGRHLGQNKEDGKPVP